MLRVQRSAMVHSFRFVHCWNETFRHVRNHIFIIPSFELNGRWSRLVILFEWNKKRNRTNPPNWIAICGHRVGNYQMRIMHLHLQSCINFRSTLYTKMCICVVMTLIVDFSASQLRKDGSFSTWIHKTVEHRRKCSANNCCTSWQRTYVNSLYRIEIENQMLFTWLAQLNVRLIKSVNFTVLWQRHAFVYNTFYVMKAQCSLSVFVQLWKTHIMAALNVVITQQNYFSFGLLMFETSADQMRCVYCCQVITKWCNRRLLFFLYSSVVCRFNCTLA